MEDGGPVRTVQEHCAWRFGPAPFLCLALTVYLLLVDVIALLYHLVNFVPLAAWSDCFPPYRSTVVCVIFLSLAGVMVSFHKAQATAECPSPCYATITSVMALACGTMYASALNRWSDNQCIGPPTHRWISTLLLLTIIKIPVACVFEQFTSSNAIRTRDNHRFIDVV